MNGLNRILLAAVSALIACIGTLGVTVPSARADLINYSFTKIADTNTLVPGGSGNFTNLGSLPSIDGGTVVFNGDGNSTNAGLDGIYSTMGGLHVVADTNTAIPGGSGNFINFQGHASLDGGTLHFTGVGGGNQYGIYRGTDGASLQTIVDINTAIPGGNGNFTEFGSVSAETNSVAFIGYRDFPAQSGNITDQGVYLAESGGGLGLVADLDTAIPDGSGNFTAFGTPSIDGGNVAFSARGTSDQYGVYFSDGGLLQEIISLNDTLDGKTLAQLSHGIGLSGYSVAFWARFTDGSTGIYRADGVSAVPEPTALAVFTLGLAALGAARRRGTKRQRNSHSRYAAGRDRRSAASYAAS